MNFVPQIQHSKYICRTTNHMKQPFLVQPEPEFRPPMSEVVQALVRLVQRANMTRRMLDGEEASRRPDDQDQEFV